MPTDFLEATGRPLVQEERNAYLAQVLDYINTVGPQPLLGLLAAHGLENGWDYAAADLTNDGVSEVLVPLGNLDVFGCQDGQYVLLLGLAPTDFIVPKIGALVDLNRDHVPELTAAFFSCGFGACLDALVLSWTGTEFQSLGGPEYSYLSVTGGTFDSGPMLRAEDTDGDGFMELLLVGDIPTNGDYDYEGPWRVETTVYAWDGAFVAPHETYFTAPKYRFQALNDADRALMAGDYAAALAEYGAVINDDTLDWWSEAKHANWVANNLARHEATPAPSPTPLPGDGGLERTQLSAYAYFRLTLLHLLQGQGAEAEAAYTTLQSNYADGGAGQPYAELGQAFWMTYALHNDMAAGCLAAQIYAEQHPDLLTPLGGSYHGWQSLYYTPETICAYTEP